MGPGASSSSVMELFLPRCPCVYQIFCKATDMSSPFGEPPKGLNLEEDSTGRNDAVVVCMYALAFVTIGFRLFSRIKVQQASIGLDDWLIVGALVCCTLSCENYCSNHTTVIRYSQHGLCNSRYAINHPTQPFNMLTFFLGGHYGLGKHVWVVTLDEIINMVHVRYPW